MIVFDFEDYKNYLRAVEERKIFAPKGFRSRIAQAAECHSAFVSQVLNGHHNFSFEQAIGISELLGHDASEKNYFLLLVGLERAGTPALRKHYRDQLHELNKKRLNIKSRVKSQGTLKEADKIRFFSCWEYAAIHLMTAMADFRSSDTIARRLNLPANRVRKILEELTTMGLLDHNNMEYTPRSQHMHLENTSPVIAQHHTNWRVQAITHLRDDNPTAQHYSSVMTISEEDAKKIKGMIVEFLASLDPLIEKSPEQDIFAFNIDFFRL